MTFPHVLAAAYQVYRQKSLAKYPTWLFMDNYEQHDVVKKEFKEVDEAYTRGDVNGEHGQIAELLDLIVVCVRRIIELSKGGGK